jgi:hypothetical protein
MFQAASPLPPQPGRRTLYLNHCQDKVSHVSSRAAHARPARHQGRRRTSHPAVFKPVPRPTLPNVEARSAPPPTQWTFQTSIPVHLVLCDHYTISSQPPAASPQPAPASHSIYGGRFFQARGPTRLSTILEHGLPQPMKRISSRAAPFLTPATRSGKQCLQPVGVSSQAARRLLHAIAEFQADRQFQPTSHTHLEIGVISRLRTASALHKACQSPIFTFRAQSALLPNITFQVRRTAHHAARPLS